MKTSSVRKRLVSPWIVGMPAFAFPFHIIKEAYTGESVTLSEPSRECYTSACRVPPSLSVQGKGCFPPRTFVQSEGCSRRRRESSPDREHVPLGPIEQRITYRSNEQRTESSSLTLDADAPSSEGAFFFLPIFGSSSQRRRHTRPMLLPGVPEA